MWKKRRNEKEGVRFIEKAHCPKAQFAPAGKDKDQLVVHNDPFRNFQRSGKPVPNANYRMHRINRKYNYPARSDPAVRLDTLYFELRIGVQLFCVGPVGIAQESNRIDSVAARRHFVFDDFIVQSDYVFFDQTRVE